MNFSDRFIKVAKFCLPTPFSIAVILTFIAALMAMLLTEPKTSEPYVIQILGFWEKGFWDLLTFAMQMLLILVLGHVLALTKPATKLINFIASKCHTTAKAALLVSFASMFMCMINWGLGLIFGAILARKIADYAHKNSFNINYPIIGASGYAGMMVWHGGLSGSAPVKVAEKGHFLANKMGVIPLSETIFSSMNIKITICLLTIVPLCVYLLAKKTRHTNLDMVSGGHDYKYFDSHPKNLTGAEHLDHSKIFARFFGGLILFMVVYKAFIQPDVISFNVVTPNFINFTLFGLGLFMYGSVNNYTAAVEDAIAGATGIILQFPLYAGIAGIMKYSGLIEVMSNFITTMSGVIAFPVLTFLSSALVNIFVPSGGGQWAVQGPIIADAANALGYTHAKGLMAFSYGDGITNMMQPFWALPLLGITKLKAQEILPFSLFIMLVGGVIYTCGLLIF